MDELIEKSYNGIFYILYKTINVINQKEYIGIHKTTNLNDGYIGNGICSHKNAEYKPNTPFRRAVVKYGYNNFKREILKFCKSYDELLKEEEKIVSYEYINRKNTYNAQTGGINPLNIDAGVEFDITDNYGNRYQGKNISEFCRAMGVEFSGINSLVNGVLKTSQGFQNTSNFIKKCFIIVNLETEEVYKTDNLNRWCRENQPELCRQKGTNLLNDIIRGRAKSALKKWWVCKEEDWKGMKFLYLNDPRYKIYKLVDEDGNIHYIEKVTHFCSLYNILPSSFYHLVNKKIKKCRNFKLYPNE